VLSSRAPIGYLAIPKAPFCTNQGCKTIKPKERISKDFLYYNLMFNINKVKNLGEGTTFAEISRAALSTVKLWFPTPKIEQAKIAEILSTVDRAIEQTEALIAKQQRIKAGLMQDLLTRGIDENGMTRSEATHTFQDSCLGRIPVEWKVGPIESRLENIIDYRGRTPTKTEMGIPLLTAKNVRDGYLSEEPREFIAEENYNRWMTRGIPAIGHVIFTTEAPMGNVARIPKYKIALAQRLITLVPKTFNLRDGFLFWLLHWARTRERLELLASGSTVSGIKQSVFRRVEFAFPVIEEQERIEHILNAVNEKVVDDSSHLLKLRRMKTSLMQDLLTGKRRVTPLLSSAPNQ
jgi:type I restriction enzyme S subunit